ncbi:hypothetical protein V3N99_19720 [Dermatophilaceae bacterium Soc4.6]
MPAIFETTVSAIVVLPWLVTSDWSPPALDGGFATSVDGLLMLVLVSDTKIDSFLEEN